MNYADRMNMVHDRNRRAAANETAERARATVTATSGCQLTVIVNNRREISIFDNGTFVNGMAAATFTSLASSLTEYGIPFAIPGGYVLDTAALAAITELV